MKIDLRRKKSPLSYLVSIAYLLTLVSVPARALPHPSPSASKRPNVLLILLDDTGFGQLSAFGGPYHTPNIDKLAKHGLRYTNFHTTALCSPTRAALMTGRNHHSVNMATITETSNQMPGYSGLMPKEAGTLAQMLKGAGYSTSHFGKWHLTPTTEAGPNGPFDHWPTSMGFDYFFGFQGADASQWRPGLWENTVPREAPRTQGYHFTQDIADRASAWIAKEASAKHSFFVYFATGAGHAPHHAPTEYVDRYKGKFDHGWDKQREITFAKQQAMGIVPKNAVLTARPPSIAAWDSLSSQEKQLFARMAEIHAGFLEHTDHEIGKLLAALEKSGELDNTLILLTSDNGASGEGSPVGSTNEMKIGNNIPEDIDENLRKIDELGGPATYNHYPAGWALAGNTPFRYWKQFTHEGGVHDPLVIAWGKGIPESERGGIRTQFSHVVDVTPTILEATGVKAPAKIDGVKQMPIEGVSFLYSIADKNAPTAKKVQYFEMLGNRGIFADGWKAVAWHGRLAWQGGPMKLESFDKDHWELFKLADDPTEAKDVSGLYPKKVEELKQIFDGEAKAHHVYPLDPTGLAERALRAKLQGAAGRTEFVFSKPIIRLPENNSPPVAGVSHSFDIETEIPDKAGEGTLVAQGGRYGGYALYLKDGKLVYQHNFVGETVGTVASTEPIPTGKVLVRFEFEKTGMDKNVPKGVARIFANGKKVAEGPLDKVTPALFSLGDTFDIGQDTVTGVSHDYVTPFPFNGKIGKVTVKVAKRTGEAPRFFND